MDGVQTGSGVGCDAGQWLNPALLCLVRAHQQGTGGAVVQAGCVGRGDRTVTGEGRAQFLHGFHGGAVADVFITVHDDVALAGLDGESGDFIGEFASLLGGFGLVLRGDGKFVLLFAADLPLFSNVFCGLTHVIAVERIPKTVTDHGVDELQIAHFLACTQVLRVGGKGHVFLTARRNDGGIAKLDVLCGQCHGTQAGAANLVDAPSGGFLWQASIDMRLTGGVLALSGGQNLTENGFGNLGSIHTGAGYDFLENGRAQIMCGGCGERASEAAHRGTCRRCDDDVGHKVYSSTIGRGYHDACRKVAGRPPNLLEASYPICCIAATEPIIRGRLALSRF